MLLVDIWGFHLKLFVPVQNFLQNLVNLTFFLLEGLKNELVNLF